MAIVETITDNYRFWDWLARSDNYSKNFSIEGARALQAYLDDLSDDIGENIEFDPIAWCCEFSEYDSLADLIEQYDIPYLEHQKEKVMDWLTDRTTVIETDSDSIMYQKTATTNSNPAYIAGLVVW
jgi:hypothetical protein